MSEVSSAIIPVVARNLDGGMIVHSVLFRICLKVLTKTYKKTKSFGAATLFPKENTKT